MNCTALHCSFVHVTIKPLNLRLMVSCVLSPQHTMLQLIKEALGQNGVTPRDDSPVTEVLNQVCPSSWRGACKTAVQLLFAQAGLVSTRHDLEKRSICDYNWKSVRDRHTWDLM